MQQKWKTISFIFIILILIIVVIFFVKNKNVSISDNTKNINTKFSNIEEKSNIEKETETKVTLDNTTYVYKNDLYNFSLNINNYLTLLPSTEISNDYLKSVGQKNVDFFSYENEEKEIYIALNIFTWDSNPEETFNKQYNDFLEIQKNEGLGSINISKPEIYLEKDGKTFYVFNTSGAGTIGTIDVWTKLGEKYLVFKFVGENSGLVMNNIEEDLIKPIISSFQEIK